MNTTPGNNFGCLGSIGIIAILAAILFPVFAQSREKARQTMCLSQQKQLGLGIMQYTDDYDECLPDMNYKNNRRETWRKMIYPYVKSTEVYQCPDRTDAPFGYDAMPGSYAANYGGNGVGGHTDKGNGAFAGPGSKAITLADFDAPASTIMLCETQNNPGAAFNIDDTKNFAASNQILWAGHMHGGNYLLADGHAKWYRPDATANLWYRNPKRLLSANGQAILAATQESFGQ